MHHFKILLTAALLITVGGCPSGPGTPGASYPPTTTLSSTSSARCESGRRCECRPLDGGAQQEEGIRAGHKRFELRLPRSTSAIWVEVAEAGVFYKAPNQVAPSCFYVDLPPGVHRITVHSENRDAEVGLQTGLTIYEYGAKEGPHWYRSLHFVCGGLNRCTQGDLKTWVGFQRRLPRGVLDPCGSVMVKGVTFGGTRAERKDDEYQDLTVRFQMKVYGFEPNRRPGSAECRAPIENR